MTQMERRLYLIRELLKEQPRYERMEIPADEEGQKRLLRSLFNIRMPRTASQEFLAVQDAYLQEETRHKGITDLANLQPVQEGIYLWQGDITTLRCDAIVNAANMIHWRNIGRGGAGRSWSTAMRPVWVNLIGICWSW